ncbi:MAG: hypothetical protein K0U72_01795 [Gammaproteobacteria bacterium]|nr:hypothetical protein [Gammaproteobacteria bacterium]
MTLPVWLVEPFADTTVSAVGTKSHNLATLIKLGFQVPDCLFIRTFDAAALPFDSSDDYLRDIAVFSADLESVLPSSAGWAVRSSATVEDLPGESHAGRFETLFIDAPEKLAEAVGEVWKSAELANVGPESMGVVLQKLVKADYAGVAFSRDPTSEEPASVIEGVAGLGTGLVDGIVTPWRIRAADGRSAPPDVNPRLIASIQEGLLQLAEFFGHEVDAEWAVSNDSLFWLQVRPLTGTSAVSFEISVDKKNELKGLWLRINHSIAPQAPLVSSMDPGGYFSGISWDSTLVNGFHYIQNHRPEPMALSVDQQEKLMDDWDRTESRLAAAFAERLLVATGNLAGTELWQEIERRIALAREYFVAYSDPLFLHVRDDAERKIKKTLASSTTETATLMSGLLSGLGSKTEHKQRLLQQIADNYDPESTDRLQDSPEWQTFVQTYGSESATTQLFYIPTLAETPELIIEMVAQLATNPVELSAVKNWQELRDSVAADLPESNRGSFRRTLEFLRRCMLRTEDDDYLLGVATMAVRTCYLQAGQYLVRESILEIAEDVFFLHGDELEKCLTTTSATVDTENVARRKRLFNAQKLLSPPPMIINGRAMSPKSKQASDELQGTAVSPGLAHGMVVVVHDPFTHMGRQLPRNAIIVAPIVTPPLAYSLRGCAALITEAGGLASHGAIVARELAIPAIVGVKTAMQTLSTGMSVTVDGSSGTVRIQR